jgi:hypothetical protein
MKIFPFLTSIILVLFTAHSLNAQLYINEFMASNDNSITDASGSAEDWVEIYNAGSAPVNLAGYYISDNIGEPLAWQIPDTDPSLTTLPAGGFLILWADKDTDDGADHIDIKLSAGGEDLVLTAPDGSTLVDSYSFGTQTTDISFGRTSDGADTWDFFVEPTPGASNTTAPGAPSVATPEFSIIGGYHTGVIQIELSVETADALIHYTTDGRIPTENDPTYNGSITISETTPLRARAFLNPLVPSDVVTETYLFNIDHSFPVVAYTADPEEMFGTANGMYTNYTEDIEIIVNAEFYEPDGTQGFNQRFESEINGTGSAVAPQKSVALKAKASLGSATIDYPIFPTTDRDTYRSLILRNSGQDNNVTHFRDVMASSLILDLSDLNGTKNTILPPRIFGQQYRPGVTYINGEYWGIMNIRERSDKRYIKNVFDLDDDQIDLLENLDEVKEGNLDAWNELKSFLQNNSLADQSNFDFVASQIDLDHYTDYVIFNLYIDNQDWPGNNDRRFRERTEEAQWRWLTYDLDFSFGLFVPEQAWNSGFNQSNSLNRLLEPNGFLWPNPEYATLLFRRLIENDQWRTQFNNRMADQLNLLFNESRVIGRIDGFQAQYEPEMQQHIDRWIQWLDWPSKIQSLRNFTLGRDDIVRNHFVEAFDDITGTADLTIILNSTDQGTVQLNTINIHQNNAPFTGKYFTGLDIPIAAIPNRGHFFESWSGALSGSNPNQTINIGGDANVTANFVIGSQSTTNIVINEINYNSSDDMDSGDWIELFNPNPNAVDLSGWYFEDESGHYFGLPANTVLEANQFLVLVADQAKFAAIYPQVTPVLGDFGTGEQGFGLSGSGELLTIKNAAGVLIDAVEYDDKNPWPTEPDGNGPTLQLISPELDNSLAVSWTAIPATPGAPNSEEPVTSLQIECPVSFSITVPAGQSNIPVNWSDPEVINFCPQGNATLVQSNGPDNGSLLAVGDYQITFLATNPCNNESNCSFFVNVIPQVISNAYCGSDADYPWHDWIANVRVAEINNSSGKSTYSDFTNISSNLDLGNTYDMILTTGFSWETFPSYWRVWIDYNQNGSFADPGELVIDKLSETPPNGTPNAITNDAFTIPISALTGPTRMRVIMQRSDPPEPCGSFPFGETEDYTVVITNQLNDDYSLNSAADQPSFRIFPNPIQDDATLIIDAQGQIKEIALVDQIGHRIETLNHTDWQQVYQLDTKSWPPGIYLIQVSMKDGRRWAKKIVVLKD